MALWVPPSVQQGLVDDRREGDAEVDRLVQHDIQTAKEFTRQLREIDPFLELVYVGKPPRWDDAVDPPPDIVFNRWHVRRNNPDAPDTYRAHTGPRGEFREPDSGIFETLAEGDMWARGWDERKRKREAREAADKARKKERERMEIREEMRDRLQAKEAPSVSMANQGRGWAYRAGARKDKRS
jgi:hypothetical protein